MRKLAFALPLVAAIAASPAAAQTIVANPETPPIQVSHIDETVNFNQLAGLGISWTYADGTSGSGTWAQIGSSTTWGIKTDTDCSNTGDFFCLTATGTDDTYDQYAWDLQGKNLKSFTINALGKNFAFDIFNSPVIGSTGSDVGRPYSYECSNVFLCILFQTTDFWSTTATYTKELAVDPSHTGVGDEWGNLVVSFGTTFGTSGTGSQVNFSTDLDKVTLDSTVTPEPGTMSLLAMGLVGMAGAARRKRNKKS